MAEKGSKTGNVLGAAELEKLGEFFKSTLKNELELNPPPAEQYQPALAEMLGKAYAQTKLNLPDEQREGLFAKVMSDMTGYGPIQKFLDDPEISEVMVNGPGLVFIEKNGVLIETQVKFEDDNHVMRVINRMLHPHGLRVDAEHPTADARLPDGSRVNVVIPPVAIPGPCVTVRKFLRNRLSIQELIDLGTLTENMAEFLQACVVARLNIIISGNTSSGKTTLLNVLSGFIPGKERIVTIEDAAELQLQQRHVVALETRPANIDGAGETTTRHLVRNVLRMRPDRIVIGEVRSGESLDMLQALNTGHDGSLTTLHANSPRDAIARLETMALMAGFDIPILAVRTQVASAINLFVHMARLTDGSRKITRITEVAGMEGEVVTLQDIFKFEQSGVDAQGRIEGHLLPTGIRPLFTPKLEVAGFKLSGEIFGAGYF